MELNEETSKFPSTIAGNLAKDNFKLLKNYEGECSDYDYQYYFYVTEIIGPQVLRDAAKIYPNKFYVKGGKAVDAYLDKKIGSPDWDLDLDKSINHEKFANKLAELFLDYGIEDIVITKIKFNDPLNPKRSFPIFQVGIPNCGEMYMIDVAQNGKSISADDIEFIEGIPFINLSNLTSELDEVIKGRERVLSEAPHLNMDFFEKQLREEVNNVDITKKELKEMLQNLVQDEDYREELEDKIDELEDYFMNLCRKVTYQNITQILDLINANQKVALKLDRSIRRLQALKDAINNPRKFSRAFISNLCERCRNETNKVILELEKQKLDCFSIQNLCD